VHLQLTILSTLALAACGGRSPPPKPPPPLDGKQLAQLIYGDLVQLGELAKRSRGKCAELTAELVPHVARMKSRHTDVELMMRDSKQATELKTELATYADRTKALTDKTAADLAATYLSCCPTTEGPKAERASCPAGYQLERVIADMPTY
jgi:hypothetical protein